MIKPRECEVFESSQEAVENIPHFYKCDSYDSGLGDEWRWWVIIFSPSTRYAFQFSADALWEF